jgi:protein-tyrosine-phosphatase
MIKAGRDRDAERIVDLCGPDGNAFCLLGMARGFAKQLNIDWEPIRTEMTSGDYSDLVLAMDKHFGSFITFTNAKKAGVKGVDETEIEDPDEVEE